MFYFLCITLFFKCFCVVFLEGSPLPDQADATPHCPYDDHDGMMACSNMHGVAFHVACPEADKEEVWTEAWASWWGGG